MSSIKRQLSLNLTAYCLFRFDAHADAFVQFKYYKKNADHFAQLIDGWQVDLFFDEFILLPLSKSPHIDLLVKRVAAKFGAAYFYNFKYLRKVHKNAKLNSMQRYFNLKDAITLKQPLPPNFYYVLFDDVLTTGATLREMHSVLLCAGVSRFDICCLTVFSAGYWREQ